MGSVMCWVSYKISSTLVAPRTRKAFKDSFKVKLLVLDIVGFIRDL